MKHGRTVKPVKYHKGGEVHWSGAFLIAFTLGGIVAALHSIFHVPEKGGQALASVKGFSEDAVREVVDHQPDLFAEDEEQAAPRRRLELTFNIEQIKAVLKEDIQGLSSVQQFLFDPRAFEVTPDITPADQTADSFYFFFCFCFVVGGIGLFIYLCTVRDYDSVVCIEHD
uniref:Uncharacterized protein n=1 Tax=Chromera velia CCMP2878 TaxID=1169474 RepID=A0A0G4F0I0_9ALVE|eukprot:Cvel_14570.t1-p1 / transcript=Cvel_14570.t1 / gene=Cvel_14570 / organism=Chromera_velia_CCMP2878 / gene_product=hypothetical protein / transcript_product=hypothetical protein / location=Cvel_scaffold1041:38668-39277(+) / protein_length=169 / sequence_SO=supercontig / SO=protein_coding / is_pseudo=false